MKPPLNPDEYQRVRDVAKRCATQLRQQAMREAQDWAVRGLQQVARRIVHGLRAPPASHPPLPSSLPQPTCLEATKPCQPLC